MPYFAPMKLSFQSIKLYVFTYFTASLCLSLFAQPATSLDDITWQLERHEGAIKAYTRLPSGSPYKEFKVISHLAAPIDSVIKVVMDIEQIARTNPYLQEFKMLAGDKTSSEVLTYFVFKTPFYTKERDLVLKYDRSRTASGFIQYAHAESDAYAANEQYIRMPLANLITVVQPLGTDSTEVIYRGTTRPGGNAPTGYINKAMLRMPMNYMRQIQETVIKTHK